MYGEQAVEKFWKKSPDFILLQLILPVTEIGHKEIRKLWKSSKNPKTRVWINWIVHRFPLPLEAS